MMNDAPYAVSTFRSVAYWITTIPVVAVLVVGGITDIVGTSYVRRVMEHLGYPSYFAVIIGLWKVPGGLTLLAPRLARLKEWAYAGAIFDFTGAVASHLAMRDPVATLLPASIFTCLALASWALRPPTRRLA
jgi:uncharacterized membrane protein YphA (DoxX/SURF4 family)